jgi:hypothetical protein
MIIDFCFQSHNVMVTVFSNTKTEPASQVFKLKYSNDNNNVDNLQLQSLGWLLQPKGIHLYYIWRSDFPIACRLQSFHHRF